MTQQDLQGFYDTCVSSEDSIRYYESITTYVRHCTEDKGLIKSYIANINKLYDRILAPLKIAELAWYEKMEEINQDITKYGSSTKMSEPGSEGLEDWYNIYDHHRNSFSMQKTDNTESLGSMAHSLSVQLQAIAPVIADGNDIEISKYVERDTLYKDYYRIRFPIEYDKYSQELQTYHIEVSAPVLSDIIVLFSIYIGMTEYKHWLNPTADFMSNYKSFHFVDIQKVSIFMCDYYHASKSAIEKQKLISTQAELRTRLSSFHSELLALINKTAMKIGIYYVKDKYLIFRLSHGTSIKYNVSGPNQKTILEKYLHHNTCGISTIVLNTNGLEDKDITNCIENLSRSIKKKHPEIGKPFDSRNDTITLNEGFYIEDEA